MYNFRHTIKPLQFNDVSQFKKKKKGVLLSCPDAPEIYRSDLHDHSVSVAVCRGIALFLSSDVSCVFFKAEKLKESTHCSLSSEVYEG